MKFTLHDLKAAHAKVETGADFPRYIREIKSQGLRHYDFMVQDGKTIYYGEDDHIVEAPAIYDRLAINPVSAAEELRRAITIHQQGQTDFPTFCKQAAEAGVYKWVIDTEKMVCIYLDTEGSILVEEPIPA
jgi:uncharacterized protein YbcV (DUF1398 family)